MTSNQFKLVLVGDKAVGKTTWLRCLIGEDFKKKYKPTLEVEVHPIKRNTNYGEVTFDVWDCANQKSAFGPNAEYYAGANCMVVMFDKTNANSCMNVDRWRIDILPTVVIRNKTDVAGRCVDNTRVRYYDFSVKNRIDLDKPLLLLARQLMGYDDLEFVP